MRSLRIQLLIVPCMALFLAASAEAEVLRGKVVSVIDGDTIKVMDQQQHKHLVQLAGSDAPEPGQNYSKHSRQNLWQLVGGREVTVYFPQSPRQGLRAGYVIVQRVDGDLDAGLAQIKAGMAWYNSENSLSESLKVSYLAAECAARAATSGLWHDPRATAPWEFLRRRRAEVYYEAVPGF